MLKKQRLVVTLIGGVAGLVELCPTAAQSQTLLETAVFLFTQKEIKETSPGVVQTYHGDGFPLQEGGSGDATWSVKDKIKLRYTVRLLYPGFQGLEAILSE